MTARAGTPHVRLEHGRHGVFESIALHFAPGMAMLVAYLYVFVPITAALELPSRLVYVATISVVVLPLLLLPFRRATVLPIRPGLKTASNGVVVLLVIGLFVLAGLVASIVSGLDGWLREHVFARVPSSIAASETVDVSGYPPAVLVTTRIASIVMVGIIVPVAEELYFRGFLLPRTPWTGAARIVGHSALFAGAHFGSGRYLPCGETL